MRWLSVYFIYSMAHTQQLLHTHNTRSKKTVEQDTNSLILASQQGDELAMNTLLNVIRKEHMPGRIRRFVQRNVLISKDEIESEFMIGCWKAVNQAKMDIGNPLHFICWKGGIAVLHLFRTNLHQGVRVNCPKCGVGELKYVAKRKTSMCAKCGETNISTFMVVTDESQQNPEFENTDKETAIWDKIDPSSTSIESLTERLFNDITYDIQIDEIRSKLNGRVLQLFDAMVIEGINRETSQNYLDEIATRWGVSTACVSVYLRKLRMKLITMRQLDAA